MDIMTLSEPTLATLVVGIGVLVLGYLIKFRGWTFLLAGYDPSAVTEEEALADLAGGTILRIGLAVIVFGGISAAGLTTPIIEGVFAIVIILAVAQLIYRSRAYTT